METIGATDCRSFVTRRSGLAAGVVLKLEVSEDMRAWSTPVDMQVRDRPVETGVVETTFLVPDAPGREREFVRLVAEYLQ